MKNKYGLNTAVITGTIDGRTTIKGFQATLNNVLTCFSPVSKSRNVLMPNSRDEIDILIATDCISEGQNLQDCDYLVNYDIHWNPVRIIRSAGGTPKFRVAPPKYKKTPLGAPVIKQVPQAFLITTNS